MQNSIFFKKFVSLCPNLINWPLTRTFWWCYSWNLINSLQVFLYQEFWSSYMFFLPFSSWFLTIISLFFKKVEIIDIEMVYLSISVFFLNLVFTTCIMSILIPYSNFPFWEPDFFENLNLRTSFLQNSEYAECLTDKVWGQFY